MLWPAYNERCAVCKYYATQEVELRTTLRARATYTTSRTIAHVHISHQYSKKARTGPGRQDSSAQLLWAPCRRRSKGSMRSTFVGPCNTSPAYPNAWDFMGTTRGAFSAT